MKSSTCTQLSKSGSGRGSVPWGKEHQLVEKCQIVIPENIIQLTCVESRLHLRIYMYVHIHICM